MSAGDRFCHKCGAEGGAAADGAQTAATGGAAPERGGAGQDRAAQPSHGQAAAPSLLSGLGRRFAAQIVDLIVMFILFWVIGSKIAAQTGGATEAGFELQGEPALLAMLLTLVAGLLYFSVLEAFWNGQTLGKKLLRIKVVKRNGAPCGFLSALTRNIVRLVDAFAFYLVGAVTILISKNNQRFGDMAAGTLVVKLSQGDVAKMKDEGKSSHVKFSMGRGTGYLDD